VKRSTKPATPRPRSANWRPVLKTQWYRAESWQLLSRLFTKMAQPAKEPTLRGITTHLMERESRIKLFVCICW
jgi:hypothetical protein